MAYTYRDDLATADVAFEATGKDLSEVFVSAADALTNVMAADLETIERREAASFSVENEDLEMLLFNFLGELVFLKDSRRLLLRVDSASIAKTPAGAFRVDAATSGEELDAARHDLVVDVKAVTLYRFSLKEENGEWKATVVLDI
jgi:SHS2 domain-containing protein